MTKTFMLLQGSYRSPWRFSELRQIAENIMAYWGRKINRYALLYYDEKSKLKDISHAYREKYYKDQDKYDSSIITTSSFASYPNRKEKGSVFFNGYMAYVCLSTSLRSQDITIQTSWVTDGADTQIFQKETKDIIEILSPFFSADIILADCMDGEKSVEYFIGGIAVSAEDTKTFTRSDYENKIALNIGRYIRYNDKIPYLFAYTSVRKALECFPKGNLGPMEFVNLDLLDRELETYPEDQTWNQYYTDWIEKGMIAPLPD